MSSQFSEAALEQHLAAMRFAVEGGDLEFASRTLAAVEESDARMSTELAVRLPEIVFEYHPEFTTLQAELAACPLSLIEGHSAMIAILARDPEGLDLAVKCAIETLAPGRMDGRLLAA